MINKIEVIFVILAFSVISAACVFTDLFIEMYIVVCIFPFIITDLKNHWNR